MKYLGRFLCIASVLLSGLAWGFGLSPDVGTDVVQGDIPDPMKHKPEKIRSDTEAFFSKKGLVARFTEPVHETLTQMIYGCSLGWVGCSQAERQYASPYVIAGVRWNDNPILPSGAGLRDKDHTWKGCQPATVTFATQTVCWLTVFEYANRMAAKDPGYYNKPSRNYIARSHFGDLQFLHAMASLPGDKPGDTRDRMMMWAEFTWRIAREQIKRDTVLGNVEAPQALRAYFPNGESVQDLFAHGNTDVRDNLREFAFGSLLHMVEDSFAAGHVERRSPMPNPGCYQSYQAGAIVQFHAYPVQDHGKHASADGSAHAINHLTMVPTLVVLGRQLKDLYVTGKTWEEVEPYFRDCIFPLDNGATVAAAGEGFGIDPPPPPPLPGPGPGSN